MEATLGVIVISIVIAAFAKWAVKLLNLLWFKPRKLEMILRQQGLCGNPYRPVMGDMKDFLGTIKAEQPRSIGLSDDILPHVLGYYHLAFNKNGRNSFFWLGPWPRLVVADPELVKEILRRSDVFQKPFPEQGKMLTGGLLFLEGEKWTKHRKIVNPAFHIDKLKNMVPAIGLSCSIMIQEMKKSMISRSNERFCEMDVWPYLEDLTGDMISRTAFGSSHEEGRSIFQLQREKVKLSMQLFQLSLIPGWRHLPFKLTRRLKVVVKEIRCLLRGIIEKRQKAKEKGEAIPSDDLLGILMESNSRSIEHGMSIEEVIEECQLFYFAGSETTSSLLIWTMVLLCQHPEWQTKAREEVSRVFGSSQPTFEGLNHLKTVTMILQEVLRLYPPAPMTDRVTAETVKLGELTIPEGVHVALLIGKLHYDPKIWGDNAKEFKPQRFSEGVPNEAKVHSSFIPFGSGPRICIGQNLALIEAKMAMSMILNNFSFELSPLYLHAPFQLVTMQPQYGAPLILRSI